MKFQQKITKLGSSKGIIIPYNIISNLNLEIGDIIEVDIDKFKLYDIPCNFCGKMVSESFIKKVNDKWICVECAAKGVL